MIFAPKWLWRSLLAFGVLIGLTSVTKIDVVLSSWFYEPDVGWRYAEAWGWRCLFEFGLRPAILMAITAFVVLLGSWLRPAWVPYRRACLAAGADGFLDKSSEFDSVATALLGLIAV